jgi:CheY-like chemotaxis protein
VLLVEDEDPVRRSAQRILERAGYHVISARHGGDAVQHLSAMRGSVDVLLTDVEMPVMNGVELAKRAAVLVPNIRIVLMSGYSDLLVPNTSATPTCALLRKPFTAASLVAALRQEALSGR